MRIGLCSKLVNDHFKSAYEDMGIKSVAELSRKTGICQVVLGRYLNLKSYPRKETETWKKLENLFGLEYEEVFPADLRKSIYEDKDSVLSKKRYFVKKVEFCQLEEAKNLMIEDARDEVDSHIIKECINDSMEKLTPKENDIIKRRYGFEGEEETLKNIADSYGVSGERIRSIESRAIKKLRKSSNRNKLNESLGCEKSFTY